MTISIKDYTPEFIRKQRVEVMEAADHDMTYQEALHLAWELLEEKRQIVDEPKKYEDAIKLLSKLFLRKII